MLTLPFWGARVVSEGDSWGGGAGEDARHVQSASEEDGGYADLATARDLEAPD